MTRTETRALARRTWLVSWVVVGIIAICALAIFVVQRGASVLFALTMAFFVAIAIEPAVSWLSRWMPRSLASISVLIVVGIALAVFLIQFGNMLVDQLILLLQAVPKTAENIIAWSNSQFGTDLSTDRLLSQLSIDDKQMTTLARTVTTNAVSLIGGAVNALLMAFTFTFFTYYLSADLPRLRRWSASMFRPRGQVVFFTAWDTMIEKVGGFVRVRVTLAALSAVVTSVFLLAIGMPYWLPLGIWTGMISQFVPSVGVYIAIAFPALVGVAGPDPIDAVWIVLFGFVYQQIENILIEPRLSATAVDVHPAMSLGAALLGAKLFGVAGAFLGVPVAATLVALLGIYKQNFRVRSETEAIARRLRRRRSSEPTGAQPVENKGASWVDEPGQPAEKV